MTLHITKVSEDHAFALVEIEISTVVLSKQLAE